MWSTALGTHSIEIWRAILSGEPVPEEQLTAAEELDEPLVEVSRIYPALSRAIAEYLAR
jgi:hypothetical protein